MNFDFDAMHDYMDMMLKQGAYDPRFDEPYEEEDEESEEYWRALGAERAYRIALSLIDKVFEKIGDAAYHQVLQKGEQND